MSWVHSLLFDRGSCRTIPPKGKFFLELFSFNQNKNGSKTEKLAVARRPKIGEAAPKNLPKKGGNAKVWQLLSRKNLFFAPNLKIIWTQKINSSGSPPRWISIRRGGFKISNFKFEILNFKTIINLQFSIKKVIAHCPLHIEN